MVTVKRLAARACLDDPAPALARAEAEAAGGDESWEQWLSEYRRGEALIIRLEVTLETNAESHEHVQVVNPGVWVERNAHRAEFEQQVAELAGKDVRRLTGRLRSLGYSLNHHELADMYVHVELDEALLRTLGGASPPG